MAKQIPNWLRIAWVPLAIIVLAIIGPSIEPRLHAQPIEPSTGGNAALSIAALSSTPVAVKYTLGTPRPGNVAALLCYNPTANAATEYVQFYDGDAAVTPGTTAAKFFVPLPVSTTTLVQLNVNMFTGIQVAATTGPTNGVAPGTALPCTVLFK